MKIIWEFYDSDIKKVVDFVNENKTSFVENIIIRNIERKAVILNKDIFLKNMLMCLLTAKNDSKQERKLSTLFNKELFLLTDEFLWFEHDIENVVEEALLSNGIAPSTKAINFFILNYFFLI